MTVHVIKQPRRIRITTRNMPRIRDPAQHPYRSDPTTRQRRTTRPAPPVPVIKYPPTPQGSAPPRTINNPPHSPVTVKLHNRSDRLFHLVSRNRRDHLPCLVKQVHNTRLISERHLSLQRPRINPPRDNTGLTNRRHPPTRGIFRISMRATITINKRHGALFHHSATIRTRHPREHRRGPPPIRKKPRRPSKPRRGHITNRGILRSAIHQLNTRNKRVVVKLNPERNGPNR